MATLTIDKRGNTAIYVKMRNGKRKPVRLGKIGRQQAERIRKHITELEGARLRGIEAVQSARAWLADVTGDLRDKLAGVELCEASQRRDDTLGDFAKRWIAIKAKTVKASTLTRLKLSEATLTEYFKPGRKLTTITAGDADDWRAWAIGERERKLSEATLRKRTADARDLFAYAIRKGAYVGDNPFAHLPAGHVTDESRRFYIDETSAHVVLDALEGAGSVPTWELRLLFGLARWGGMRVPSEPAALTWADVDFDKGRIRVDSPKTGPRVVPMFPELRPLLMEAFEQAEPGQVRVLPCLERLTVTALRKHLLAGIKRAGLVEWPKLWINLRSSRETDLTDRHPLHAVVKWIGNSQPVATKHYLQITDVHFEAATRDNGEVVREAVRAGGAGERTEHANPCGNRTEPHETVLATCQVAPVGLEPTRALLLSGF